MKTGTTCQVEVVRERGILSAEPIAAMQWMKQFRLTATFESSRAAMSRCSLRSRSQEATCQIAQSQVIHGVETKPLRGCYGGAISYTGATASIFLARATAKAKALFAEGGMLLCSLRLARLGYGVVEAKG